MRHLCSSGRKAGGHYEQEARGKGESQPIALAEQKNGPSFFIASLDHFTSRVKEARTEDVVGGGREGVQWA